MNDPARPAGRQSAVDSPMQAARSPAGLTDAVRDQAGGYANRRRTEAAGFLSELARALRSGGELHGQTQANSFVHTGADNLDALSGRFAGPGWRELYRDAETLSRSNPLATALVVGALRYGAFHVMQSGNVEARKPPGEPWQAWGGYP